MGPDKEEILHGTHVAGIVAQVRGNNLGGDGVANNNANFNRSCLMVVMSTIKISLGIRYAVDNGAKVINGSFGKVFLHTSNGCMTQLNMLRKRCIDCSRCRK
jgi:subtilisin family serine protease